MLHNLNIREVHEAISPVLDHLRRPAELVHLWPYVPGLDALAVPPLPVLEAPLAADLVLGLERTDMKDKNHKRGVRPSVCLCVYLYGFGAQTTGRIPTNFFRGPSFGT